MKTSGADVLSFRKKLQKTSEWVGNHPPPTLLVRPRVFGIALHHLHWLQIAITKTPEKILFNNEISNLKQGFSDVYISQQISMMNTSAISLASYFPPASLHFINVGDPSAVIGIRTLYRNLPAINGFAVDWFGNNIYWLVEDQIMVSRTDGRYLKTLRVDFSMDSNLMLDPERG